MTSIRKALLALVVAGGTLTAGSANAFWFGNWDGPWGGGPWNNGYWGGGPWNSGPWGGYGYPYQGGYGAPWGGYGAPWTGGWGYPGYGNYGYGYAPGYAAPAPSAPANNSEGK
ncbi:MAG: sulfur globule protein CV3 [bacterium]